MTLLFRMNFLCWKSLSLCRGKQEVQCLWLSGDFAHLDIELKRNKFILERAIKISAKFSCKEDSLGIDREFAER